MASDRILRLSGGRACWRRGLAALAVGAAAAWAAPAAADPVQFSLTGSTGVHRDENFFRNSVNVEEKDLGGVSLTLRVSQQRPRMEYDLTYVPAFQREFDSPHYTTENHRLGFSLKGSLSERTELRLRERLVRSDAQTDLFDESSSDAFVIVPLTERFEHAFHGILAHDLGRRNGIELGLIHEQYEYETHRLFDGEVYGGTAAYAWWREDATRFEVIGRALRHDRSERDSTDIVSVGTRYRRPLDRWHELVFDLGAFQARGPADPALRDNDETREGWYGGVTYGWATGRRATSRAQLRRDVAPSPGVGFSSIADLAQFLTTLTLGDRVLLDLTAQGTRHRLIFESEEVTEAVLADARLRWVVRPGLELRAGVGRIHQRSDSPALDDLDYNRYFVGTSFTLYRRGPAPSTPGLPPEPGNNG